MSMTKKLLLAAGLLLATAASAQAQEFTETGDQMSWTVKNRTKMDCRLSAGMTMKRGLDFVETKKLVCYDKGALLPAVTTMVVCGPEGSVTRVGKKIKVTCDVDWSPGTKVARR